MEEWIIITLLVIFVIMFFTLKPIDSILFNTPQTHVVQYHKDVPNDLVMLPKPNPASLISTR